MSAPRILAALTFRGVTPLMTLLACLSFPAVARAQPQEAAPKPAQQAPRVEPRIIAPGARGQLINIRVEVTITDQRGADKPVVKNASMTVADGERGSVRTTAQVPSFSKSPAFAEVPLNLDAGPRVLEGGKIRLELGLAYDLIDTNVPDEARRPVTEIRETLAVILENGKPLVVTQSADPVSERKVTLEVKATVLR
jgi:hypothetical protein